MSSIDLTTALARLLSERELRARFRHDREQAAAELEIRAADRTAFLALDAAAVDQQAAGLVDKRYHEVARLVPRTVQRLGEAARPLFREYACGRWPTGHRRHLIDAIRFCEHLSELSACAVCRSELNWLLFAAGKRRVAVHFVPDLMIRGRKRRGVQVLFRSLRGRPCQSVWYLDV